MSGSTTDGGPKGHSRIGRMAKIVRRGLDDARQIMHPRPFRIGPLPDLVTVPKHVSDGQPAASAGATEPNLDADCRKLLQTLAAVATAIWRVRMKLEARQNGELPFELRHLHRHMQAAWDALAAGGFRVEDHKGQRYDPGMAVHPVTYTPDSSVPPNTIVQALKPSVFWKELLVQRADVILAEQADVPKRGTYDDGGLTSSSSSGAGRPGGARLLPSTQDDPEEETDK